MLDKDKFLNSLVVANIVKMHAKNRNMCLVDSFKDVYSSKLFELINNNESGLNLEDDRFLTKALEIELDFGIEKMLKYIQSL